MIHTFVLCRDGTINALFIKEFAIDCKIKQFYINRAILFYFIFRQTSSKIKLYICSDEFSQIGKTVKSTITIWMRI